MRNTLLISGVFFTGLLVSVVARAQPREPVTEENVRQMLAAMNGFKPQSNALRESISSFGSPELVIQKDGTFVWKSSLNANVWSPPSFQCASITAAFASYARFRNGPLEGN